MIPCEHSFFIYMIDDKLLGLRLGDVDRVLPAARLLDPLQSSPGLAGFLNYQGQVIPVLDLREILRLQPAPLRASDRIVLARAWGGVIGLIVDEALGVYEAAWIGPAPADVEGLTLTPAIEGFASFEDKLVIILDLQQVLASGRAWLAGTIQGAPESVGTQGP